jgi:hypothetical protein
MKRHLCGILIYSLSAIAFPANNNRQGVVFSIGLQPDFSWLLVSTFNDSSQSSYSHYLGAVGPELRIGYSRNGKNVSSFVSGFTWNYPSSLFLFSLFGGYGFTHYFQESTPGFAYDFTVGLTFVNTIGLEKSYPSLGFKTGFKAGYEFAKRWGLWLGTCTGGEIRSYSINKTGMNPADPTGTIIFYGPEYATDFILNNSMSLSVSYTIY